MSPLWAATEEDLRVSGVAAALAAAAGIVVGVRLRGETRWFIHGAGVDEGTSMEVGSVTKVFTGMLVAEAVRTGRLSLSTTVGACLFGEPAGAGITVGQLLTHRSGLPRLSISLSEQSSGDPYAGYSPGDLMEYLRSCSLAAPAVPVFAYSNLGYAVLGLMLERVYDCRYEDLLAESVLKPCGMERSYVQVSGGATRPGYNAKGVRVGNWHQQAYAPCGALCSTGSDLMRVFGGMLGPEGAFALTREAIAGGDGRTVGYGWIFERSGEEAKGGWRWHNGATGGYSSYVSVNDGLEGVVVVLANQSLPEAVTALGQRVSGRVAASL